MLLNPLAGMVIGAAAGAVSGSLTDYGINDDFVSCLFSMWFAFPMFWLLNTKKTVNNVITRMVTNF